MITTFFSFIAISSLILFLLIVFKTRWKIPGASEALIITGSGAKLPEDVRRKLESDEEVMESKEGLNFKIVVGRGTFLRPITQRMAKLSLSSREALISISSVTTQGIELQIRSVVLWKVGDDVLAIARAARRFAGRDEDQMDEKIRNVLAGHLRSVIGTMSVEDIMREREVLATRVREACTSDITRIGLQIDSFQIQEIQDTTGYIRNIGAKDEARVEKEARIAKADADREASAREADAGAQIAEARAESGIREAEAMAQKDQARAIASQAGPLAMAKAQEDVVKQNTLIAELAAQQKEKQLESEVIKPADAEAYKTRTIADAARDAAIAAAEAEAKADLTRGNAVAEVTQTQGAANASATQATGTAEAEVLRAQGLAEAEARRAQGLAEADAIEARAAALATNQEAVITQELTKMMPEIVREAAGAFNNVGQMTVLNGAEGVSQAFHSALGMGVSSLPVIMEMVRGVTGDGSPLARASIAAGGDNETAADGNSTDKGDDA